MNALFLVFLIVEAIFGIGFLFSPGLMMDPMGVTLDETSTTFARMVGSLIISLTVLLFFARKSASSEFKGGGSIFCFCISVYEYDYPSDCSGKRSYESHGMEYCYYAPCFFYLVRLLL